MHEGLFNYIKFPNEEEILMYIWLRTFYHTRKNVHIINILKSYVHTTSYVLNKTFLKQQKQLSVF